MSDFSSVHCWWDIDRVPLLPPEQGTAFDDQLAAGLRIFKKFADSGEPFSFIRLGDSDVAMLGAGLMRLIHPVHDTDRLLHLGGTNRESLSFRPLLIDAVKRTDILGLQQNWNVVSEATFAILCMLQIPFPVVNAVEVHLSYALLASGALFDYIAGRRVLLIGSLAADLAALLQGSDLSKRYSFVKPLQDVQAITVPGLMDNAYEVYPEILAQVLKAEFDVALLAFGTFAKPLAVAIRDSGRTGLDIGFCFDALLGHKERTVRPVLRDVNWDINPETRPRERQS